LLDAAGTARLNVGSGVVHDSRAPSGPNATSRRASHHPAQNLRLIETLRFDPERGYPYLAEHLERISDSARCFGFPFDAAAFRRLLAGVAADSRCACASPSARRAISRWNTPRSRPARRGDADGGAVAPSGCQPDLLLRHKTTARALYDRNSPG
jgi:para-aminobenzoate synthetase/4-amino-4-deoxychorismate lyase